MLKRCVLVPALVSALGCLFAGSANAQSATTFTYQGSLTSSNTPVTGEADLRARLFTAAVGGTPVGDLLEFPNTAITEGRFTVPLDFGDAFSNGQPRWIEFSVRAPAGSGGFTLLTPRQPITAAPIAQGLAGVSLARGGPETLDQAQDQNSHGASNIAFNAPCWQSWTPAVTGALTRLQLFAGTGPDYETLNIVVHYGRGTSGPILGATTITFTTSNFDTIIDIGMPSVPVQAGSVYTLAFSGTNVVLRDITTPILGAYGNRQSYPENWWFRTYVTPSASINANSTSAAFATVAGAAINAASAPWAGLTGQATVTTGAIGAGWQLLFNNTANASFRGGMRLADSGFFEMTNNAGAANPSFARLASTGAWSAVSDARLKADVTNAEGNLAAALRLRPVNFRWKHDGTEDFGLIAQEVRDVLPRLVTGDESKESLTLNYGQLSVVAIGAIQELKAENDQIRRENTDLKARLERLEKALEAMTAGK